MAVLLPFRAFYSSPPIIYIPGEEPPPALRNTALTQDTEPALFIYRQQFCFPGENDISVRKGVMGLLNRAEASVFPHEETFPDRVAACARTLNSPGIDPGSLWLWCNDPRNTLVSLLTAPGPASVEAIDNRGCLHQIWPITDPVRVRNLQVALDGKTLFLADGHHRFAAGWDLATIQIRSRSLRSLASHRLVLNVGSSHLPEMPLVEDIDRYLEDAPPGYSRSVVVTRGPVFRGIEMPDGMQAQRLLIGANIQPIREISQAVAAVQAGRAQMALLVSPYTLTQLEQDAIRGVLLPPQSTDFYPKLAAGLVRYQHQNENVAPPVAQRPGVRYPSS